MTEREWDLDSPATPSVPATVGAGVLLLALLLAAVAAGGLSGTLLAGPDTPHTPLAATLSPRDLYVDPVTSADEGNPDGSLIGRPVVVVRIMVDNPGTTPAHVTALVLDGVAGRRIVSPVDLRLPPGDAGFVDIAVRPLCSTVRPPTTPRARLLVEAASSVPVSLNRGLDVAGGFCSLFDTRLPNGWRTPWQVLDARRDGADLVLRVPDLSDDGLSGIVVGQELLPTVFIDSQLVSSSARLVPGHNTVLRLRGPAPCFAGDSASVPTTIRLLARENGGLEQRLVIVGVKLTRWLRSTCAG